MSKIPTHYPVKYKCGHTAKRDLSKVPPSRRAQAAQSDFFATKAGKDGDGMVCPRCFTASREHDRDAFLNQLMLDTEAFEVEHHMPSLEGTEKMVTSGLITSARRDRYSVLDEILGHETGTDADTILTAARSLTWAGWWATNLGYKTRTQLEYGPEEYVELITDGAAEEAKRDARDTTARITSENPHDWNPDADPQ